MLSVAPITHRWQIVTMLPFRSVAVEIGTHRGVFARELLSVPDRYLTLFCVDPWSTPPGYESQAETLTDSQGREADFRAARKLLRNFPFARMVRAESLTAVKGFEDQSLDLVYLDGDHRRSMVEKDLSAWWPKIKSGGYIAGHDFLCPGEYKHGWGSEIQPAVFQFAKEFDLTIQLITEGPLGLPWSFMMEKP